MTPLEAKYSDLILCILSRHFIDEIQVPEYKELGKLMRALYFFQDGECTKLCRKKTSITSTVSMDTTCQKDFLSTMPRNLNAWFLLSRRIRNQKRTGKINLKHRQM